MDAPRATTLRRHLSRRDLIVYGLLFIGPLAPVGVFGVLDARTGGAVALGVGEAAVVGCVGGLGHHSGHERGHERVNGGADRIGAIGGHHRDASRMARISLISWLLSEGTFHW